MLQWKTKATKFLEPMVQLLGFKTILPFISPKLELVSSEHRRRLFLCGYDGKITQPGRRILGFRSWFCSCVLGDLSSFLLKWWWVATDLEEPAWFSISFHTVPGSACNVPWLPPLFLTRGCQDYGLPGVPTKWGICSKIFEALTLLVRLEEYPFIPAKLWPIIGWVYARTIHPAGPRYPAGFRLHSPHPLLPPEIWHQSKCLQRPSINKLRIQKDGWEPRIQSSLL